MKKGIFLAFSVALFLGCSQTQPKPSVQNSLPDENVYKPNERISLLDFEMKQDASSLPQNIQSASFDQEEILQRRFKVFTLRGVKSKRCLLGI